MPLPTGERAFLLDQQSAGVSAALAGSVLLFGFEFGDVERESERAGDVAGGGDGSGRADNRCHRYQVSSDRVPEWARLDAIFGAGCEGARAANAVLPTPGATLIDYSTLEDEFPDWSTLPPLDEVERPVVDLFGVDQRPGFARRFQVALPERSHQRLMETVDVDQRYFD
jgi:hypothetical protein